MRKYWSSARLDDEVVAGLWELRKSGLTLREIGEKHGTTGENIRFLFSSRGYEEGSAVCALPECDVEFFPKKSNQHYCCRKHAKRGCTRRELGIEIGQFECPLPECRKLVWVTHKKGEKPTLGVPGGRKYCCDEHAQLHTRRCRNGFYLKLLEKGTPSCEVCGEKWLIEEHHESYGPNGSDLDSPTHWLCVTHHQMIHRGYASYVEGKFQILVGDIVKGLKRKDLVYDNYLKSLRSWEKRLRKKR